MDHIFQMTPVEKRTNLDTSHQRVASILRAGRIRSDSARTMANFIFGMFFAEIPLVTGGLRVRHYIYNLVLMNDLWPSAMPLSCNDNLPGSTKKKNSNVLERSVQVKKHRPHVQSSCRRASNRGRLFGHGSNGRNPHSTDSFNVEATFAIFSMVCSASSPPVSLWSGVDHSSSKRHLAPPGPVLPEIWVPVAGPLAPPAGPCSGGPAVNIQDKTRGIKIYLERARKNG